MESNFESNFFTLLEFLDANSRLEINGLCSKKSVAAGEMVYNQGDPANGIFIVASGVVAPTWTPGRKTTHSASIWAIRRSISHFSILKSGMP